MTDTGEPRGNETVEVGEAIGATAAFLLDDPDALLEVLEGRVDVFAIPAGQGVTGGPRQYLWSANAGETLLGFDLADPSRTISLVAVAIGGTRLRHASAAQLRAGVAFRERHREVTRLIDGLLPGLATAVAARGRPVFDVLMEPNHVETLDDDQRATAGEKSAVWIQIEKGTAFFIGDDQITLDPESPAIPVAHGVWLRASGRVRLSSSDTMTLVESGQDPLVGLRALQYLMRRWVERRTQEDEEEERTRLHRKAEADARMRARGLARLATVLGGEVAGDIMIEDEDDLMRALRVVGRAAGIDFKAAAKWEVEGRSRDTLGAVCRASRVSYRQVALRDDWWRSDAGPLLAFTEVEKAPRALVPLRQGGYEVVDPATGRRDPLTPEIAARLETIAFAFYVPAPDMALGTRDILQMAFRGLRTDIVAVFSFALVGSLLGLLVPVATDHMFDNIIPSARVGDAIVLVTALAAVHLGQLLFEITRAFTILRVEGKSHGGLQASFVDRLLGLPVPFFRDYTVGDLADRVGAVNAVRDIASGAGVNAILGGVTSVVYLGLLVIYKWKLALLAVVIVVVAALFTVLFGSRTVRLQRRVQLIEGRISGFVFQLIDGIAKLRVSGSEGRGFTRWSEQFREQREFALRAGHRENVVQVFNAVLPLIAAGLLFYFVGRAEEPMLTTSRFVAFNAAFGTFFRAARLLSDTIVLLLVAIPIFERAKPILQALPETRANRPDPGELSGLVEAAHLAFRYRPTGPIVLDDVSFTAKPGEFIALVGPSGSGKSTILRLLLGFETPQAGSIYYDGQDLGSLDITGVRAQLGVVLQTSRVTAGTVFENIIGSAPLTMDDAWAAAEQAGLTDDIMAMPMGMHTVLSEGATTLSGGQRQRLLIARALVRKPRIMLFDEATSALDNRTQEIVSRSLEETYATRIVIAHRLSTIRNADRIYVMEAGRIAQEGSFDQLVTETGLFERLVRRQVA